MMFGTQPRASSPLERKLQAGASEVRRRAEERRYLRALEEQKQRERQLAEEEAWRVKQAAERAERMRLAQIEARRRMKLADLLGDAPEPPRLIARRIRNEVADKHEVTVADLDSDGRQTRLVTARHEAIFRIICETPFSLPQIARMFGDRDHTSILYAAQAHAYRNGLPAPRAMGFGKFESRKSRKP